MTTVGMLICGDGPPEQKPLWRVLMLAWAALQVGQGGSYFGGAGQGRWAECG